MTRIQETSLYVWRELAFPLWHEPRPAFNEFVFVDALLKKSELRTEVTRKDPKDDNGLADNKGWLHWEFSIPISNEERLRIQAELDEHFGDTHFRWAGHCVVTQLYDTIAFGCHSPQ